MITTDEIELIKQVLPFWENLTNIQQNFLTEHSFSSSYQKGQELLSNENECIGVLILKKGNIRAYITSEEGREITIYRMEHHDVCILSASCVLQTIDFHVFVHAESDCEIIQISVPAFLKLTNDNIYVELFSYKLATERFADMMWAMQQILFTSFDKRLATFLMEETTRENTDTLHMTHEQIAKYMGSAREVVSRMLNYFAKEGYVTLSRGTIQIIDFDKLKQLI